MDQLIYIEGDEQSHFIDGASNGGLPPVVGVQSWCVFRASKDVPELSDGYGWTYHHHVDMACWRGKLYVGWNSCEEDEDVWPSRELYSTSDDGRTWTPPQELFPQGISTPLRMYFFHASNGKMLTIAGLRVDLTDTDEDRKFGLVVREIHPDHTLGEVFTLQTASGRLQNRPALFEDSNDKAFVEACRQLLVDNVYLEQQDRGRLLGERRMKWHDAGAWPAGSVPGDSEKWVAGKAYSFFRRPDGAIIGISKMGWTTISTDNGENWAQPIVPSTLITGKAKVWAQQTRDGRFALVYNPSRRQRYPLVIVSGEDGIHFRDMRVVQGELPRQRYKGKFRSVGPQYVRGISHWANDGSRDENAIWLVYSMSKEDIWVSRVPLPVKADVPDPAYPAWNTYCPKWDGIEISAETLVMRSCDPYDNCVATRIFPATKTWRCRFSVCVSQSNRGRLSIGFLRKFDIDPVVEIVFNDEGRIALRSMGQAQAAGKYGVDQATEVEACVAPDCYTFTVGDFSAVIPREANGPQGPLHRMVVRAGTASSAQSEEPVPTGTDRPGPGASYRISLLAMES